MPIPWGTYLKLRYNIKKKKFSSIYKFSVESNNFNYRSLIPYIRISSKVHIWFCLLFHRRSSSVFCVFSNIPVNKSPSHILGICKWPPLTNKFHKVQVFPKRSFLFFEKIKFLHSHSKSPSRLQCCFCFVMVLSNVSSLGYVAGRWPGRCGRS